MPHSAQRFPSIGLTEQRPTSLALAHPDRQVTPEFGAHQDQPILPTAEQARKIPPRLAVQTLVTLVGMWARESRRQDGRVTNCAAARDLPLTSGVARRQVGASRLIIDRRAQMEEPGSDADHQERGPAHSAPGFARPNDGRTPRLGASVRRGVTQGRLR